MFHTFASTFHQVKEFHTVFGHPIGQNILTPLSESRWQLRIDLIDEEYNELLEGMKKESRLEVADALCDLQYVLMGFLIELGVDGAQLAPIKNRQHIFNSNFNEYMNTLRGLKSKPPVLFSEISSLLQNLQYCISNLLILYKWSDVVFLEMFNAVHVNNMSKACKTEQDAQETVVSYQNKTPPVEANYRQVGNYFVVYRQDNNKILKANTFVGVDLSPWV